MLKFKEKKKKGKKEALKRIVEKEREERKGGEGRK